MKRNWIYCFIFVLFASLLIGCTHTNTEKRYTITKEEWDSLVGECNYTVESKDNDGIIFYNYIQKYTENVIDLNGSIIIFLDDKQYLLNEEETGFVAYDCTSINYEKGYLLAGYNFEDLTYDESKKVYVSQMSEKNSWNEVMFENGVLIKITTFTLREDLNLENCHKVERIFTNIGKTIIDLPEYTIYNQDVVTTVTEEEWNKYKNEYNFSLIYFTYDSNGMKEHVQSSIEGAYFLNEKYYVTKDEKMYLLTEGDDGWIGTEIDSFPGYKGSLLQGLSFSDVVYDETEEAYVTKNVDKDGFIYYFYFSNGLLEMIILENTLSSDDDKYFAVNQIGEIEFDLPEYVIN